MTLTIRGKILVIATAVILVAIAAVIATSAVIATKEYKSALESRSLAIGKSLSIQLERLFQLGLNLEDIVGFEEQCQEIVSAYNGIDVALVADENGEVVFHSASVAARLSGALKQSVQSAREGIVRQSTAGNIWYNAVVPARSPQGEHLASIVVAFPGQAITSKLQRLLLVDLGVSAAVLLTGLAVLYAALARFVTTPLGNLLNTVTKLRAAPLDLTRRAPANTSDEVGHLGEAFNRMMSELQATTVSKTELEQSMEEQQRLSAALFEQKEQAEVTLHSIGDAVISVDSKARVHYLNPVAEQLCGWSQHEAEGLPLQNVLHLFDAASKTPLPNPFEPAFFKGEAISNRVDAELLSRDGTAIGVDYTASPMHGPEGELSGGVLTLRDVSRERTMAQRLSWEASHDALTGLYNRREFTERLEAALQTAADPHTHHVVFFMDLDNFKLVNDTAGHAAGDELLKALALSLSERIRPSDTLARLGGDEFALLLEDCPMEQAERIAANLLSSVESVHLEHNHKSFHVGVSIGMAAVDGTASCAQVLSMADTACYMAKEQGRNQACVFRASNKEIVERRRRADWAARINSALKEDRFTLHQQCSMPLTDEAATQAHVEVLVRMTENDQLIQPPSFLPSAEHHQLMPAIDRWVVRKVFAEYHKLAQTHSKPLVCSINISDTSLNSNEFYEFVKGQMQAHGLPDGVICFEITEPTALSTLPGAIEFARKCRGLGIKITLDNFGAGASSFAYLKDLPVDYLKVGGCFIRNIHVNELDKTMAETVNRIGHIMGISTIAKFVESEDALETAKAMGFDYAQGFTVEIPRPLIS